MPGGYPVAAGARRDRHHPDGYQVAKGDPAAIGRVADGVKQTMGPRSATTTPACSPAAAPRTAPRSSSSTPRSASRRPTSCCAQQESAEEKAGVGADTISVGSADGRLYQAPDGGWVAVAPAGACAMVLLVSDREELIRDAAILVMNDGVRDQPPAMAGRITSVSDAPTPVSSPSRTRTSSSLR